MTADEKRWHLPNFNNRRIDHNGTFYVEVTNMVMVFQMSDKKLNEFSPQEIRRIREKIGLSQVEAGELLGGGPRAFTKYEVRDHQTNNGNGKSSAFVGRQPINHHHFIRR